MSKKDQSFLGRYNILSALVMIGADLVATPTDAGGVTYPLSIALAMIASFIIFLNEWFVSGKFRESIVDSLVAVFLIAIPTPLTGVIVGAAILYEKLGRKI